MPIRKRSSARAAVAAAISLITVTGLSAGQALGTPSGGATHSKPATALNGSSALNTPRALDLTPQQTGDESAERGPGQAATHTVAPGDTLWDIAQRNLGNGLLWTTIYDSNQRTVEDEARRHGYPSSDRGHWIFPGTVLKVKVAGPDGSVRRSVNGSPAARTALSKVQERIADYVAQNDTTYTFASHLDTTGRIVLGTDAPANVVAQLTDLSGTPESEVQAVRNMQVIRGTVDTLQSRRDDAPPFKGGGAIDFPLPQGEHFCSTGYAVESLGIPFMVTAGHCYEDGLTVFTPSGNALGDVSNRRLPSVTGDQQDMELIGGQEYAGRIFTGGVNSTTTTPVFGAGPAVELLYNDYCHSGATTGEACGHTVTYDAAQICGDELYGGCVGQPLLAFVGGRLTRGGDSGGPFYAKGDGGAFIRGHIIASLDVGLDPENRTPVVSYAVPWTVVSDEYGVDIVTD